MKQQIAILIAFGSQMCLNTAEAHTTISLLRHLSKLTAATINKMKYTRQKIKKNDNNNKPFLQMDGIRNRIGLLRKNYNCSWMKTSAVHTSLIWTNSSPQSFISSLHRSALIALFFKYLRDISLAHGIGDENSAVLS